MAWVIGARFSLVARVVDAIGQICLVAIMMLGFAVRLPNFVVFISNHPSYMVVEVLAISVVVVTVDVIVKVKSRHGGNWQAGRGF